MPAPAYLPPPDPKVLRSPFVTVVVVALVAVVASTILRAIYTDRKTTSSAI